VTFQHNGHFRATLLRSGYNYFFHIMNWPTSVPSTAHFLHFHNNKWEGNIKMDRREIGLEGVDWVDLAHDVDR
jgi:hypothetical protein